MVFGIRHRWSLVGIGGGYLNDLERQVLRLIGEDPAAPDVFTDDDAGMAPIRDSINDAIEEVSLLTGGYTEIIDVPLIEGRTFYRLHLRGSTFAWVRSAWLMGEKVKLEHTDLTRLNTLDGKWMFWQDRPSSYFQIGHDWLGFFPRASTTDDVVRITAVCLPERYTRDGQRIKVREDYKRGLVHYAVSEYYASRGDAQRAGIHWEMYGRHVADALGWPTNPQRRITLKTGREPKYSSFTPREDRSK
jgi:hypothetical protein